MINLLSYEKREVTAAIVEYYRQNPKELDLIIDKEEFNIRFLSFFFFLGITLTVGARILKYFFEDAWATFINDVILDVASELGIAIFGGAVTAYFLEYLQKKQYEENVRYRGEILKHIKEREGQTNT
ncbi:MAG: hypothetical protein AAF806_20940 [Bacteroidota bacterium]